MLGCSLGWHGSCPHNYAANDKRLLSPLREVGIMPITNFPLQEGMEVLGSDGQSLGRVKEVGNTEFLVDRRMRPDLRLPLDLVESVDGNQVKLAVTSEQAVKGSWPSDDRLGPDIRGKTGPSDLTV
jgi:hypothetical protein